MSVGWWDKGGKLCEYMSIFYTLFMVSVGFSRSVDALHSFKALQRLGDLAMGFTGHFAQRQPVNLFGLYLCYVRY